MLIYYFPTYFQGAKGTSAIRSAVLLFPTACLVGTLAMRNTSRGLNKQSISSIRDRIWTINRTLGRISSAKLHGLGAHNDRVWNVESP